MLGVLLVLVGVGFVVYVMGKLESIDRSLSIIASRRGRR